MVVSLSSQLVVPVGVQVVPTANLRSHCCCFRIVLVVVVVGMVAGFVVENAVVPATAVVLALIGFFVSCIDFYGYFRCVPIWISSLTRRRAVSGGAGGSLGAVVLVVSHLFPCSGFCHCRHPLRCCVYC